MVSQPYPFVTRAEHVLVVPGGAKPSPVGRTRLGRAHVDVFAAGVRAAQGSPLPERFFSPDGRGVAEKIQIGHILGMSAGGLTELWVEH